MLRIINVISGYGKLNVIRSVSLSVKPGEVVAIIGGNGAGKSTLLKTAAGLVNASEGKILLAGDNIIGLPAENIAKKGLVLVPENRALFPNMTIMDNLKAGAGISKQSAQSRYEFVFELFPVLYERKNSRAGELSGGQQQMLAIGRALMTNPKALLLDEPSTGLAPLLVNELFEKLTALKEKGMTILIAEQNINKALELADRGYVLENGKIILEDVSEELKCNDMVQKAYLGI